MCERTMPAVVMDTYLILEGGWTNIEADGIGSLQPATISAHVYKTKPV